MDFRKRAYNKHAWMIDIGYKYVTYNYTTYKTLKEFEDMLWKEDYQKVINLGYGLMYHTYFNGHHKKRDIIYEIISQIKALNIYEPTDKERIDHFLSM